MRILAAASPPTLRHLAIHSARFTEESERWLKTQLGALASFAITRERPDGPVLSPTEDWWRAWPGPPE